MSIPPQQITLSCGCTATWNDLEEQYNAEHTCSEQARRAEVLQARRKSREESEARLQAPLHGAKGFKLMR